jgi:hypothetical protein
MPARGALAASAAAVPEPLTTLLGMATSAVCTRRFGDGGPATTPTMFGMCLLFSAWAIDTTFAESAAVSFPWSVRENTMIAVAAVTSPACGNARACRVAARMDS